MRERWTARPFNDEVRNVNAISAKPHLVIISGPPAAGKSTNARPLARAIGYPLLCMDQIKEGLADAIGPDALQFADQLGEAAVRQVISFAKELLHNNIDVIIEGFFQSDRYSSDLAEITGLANTVLIHLKASDAELKARYENRALAASRHWIHGDLAKLGTLTPELPEFLAKSLQLDVGRITIDTTNKRLDIPALAAQVRALLQAQA